MLQDHVCKPNFDAVKLAADIIEDKHTQKKEFLTVETFEYCRKEEKKDSNVIIDQKKTRFNSIF